MRHRIVLAALLAAGFALPATGAPMDTAVTLDAPSLAEIGQTLTLRGEVRLGPAGTPATLETYIDGRPAGNYVSLTPSYRLDEPVPGTRGKHTVRVVAWSEVSSLRAQSAIATFHAAERPTAPTLAAEPAGETNAIRLAWTPPADDGGTPITGYRLMRANGTDETWTLRATFPASASGALDPAPPRTPFRYRLVATNLLGPSPPSAEVDANVGEGVTADRIDITGASFHVCWSAADSGCATAVAGSTVRIGASAFFATVEPRFAGQLSRGGLALPYGNVTGYYWWTATNCGPGMACIPEEIETESGVSSTIDTRSREDGSFVLGDERWTELTFFGTRECRWFTVDGRIDSGTAQKDPSAWIRICN